MNNLTAATIIEALALPTGARVDQRVPKKLLVENGAPTAADKKQINDGIESLSWIAALKPTTIGVPDYRDDAREYLEIALLSMTVRPGAKTKRLTELVHRAIPYPVLLISEQGPRMTVSLAHIRWSQAEAGKTVLDGDIVSINLDEVTDAEVYRTFLGFLALAQQYRTSLHALYQGWIDTVLTLQAACITGEFVMSERSDHAVQRAAALVEGRLIEAQISNLRTAAAKEKQISKQVQLNLELQRLKAKLAASRAQL